MKSPLTKQFVRFFNRSRNAGIKSISFYLNADPVIHYNDGVDIPVRRVRTMVGLFDVLNKLHPRKTP